MPIFTPQTFEEFDNIINGKKYKLCIVDFYAEWCKPCKLLGKDLTDEFDNVNDVCVIKIDIDNSEFDELCKSCTVVSIPKIVYFKNSVITKKVTEGYNFPAILDQVDSLLN
jgi:thioredoxin 1